MHALDVAQRLLDEHRVAELVAEVAEAEGEVWRRQRELARAAQGVSWWDRVAFWHDSDEEQQAEAADERLAQASARAAEARRRRDEAVRACAAQSPPIEAVFRIESALHRVLADPYVGRVAERGEVAAEQLDAAADDVLARWAPGTHVAETIDRLLSDDDLAAVGRSVERLATDPALGWAPMPPQELYARAAHELLTRGELAQARGQLDALHVRREQLGEAVESLEASIGVIDALIPGSITREEIERDQHQARLSATEQAIVRAFEGAQHAVVQALSAHPVIWLALACRAAAAALRAVSPRYESVIGAHGELTQVPSAYCRAVALACLVEVRRACDAAFEGLAERIWPRAGDAPDPRRGADVGPYRLQGFIAREPPPLVKGSTAQSRALFEELEQGPLREVLSWAVAHATVLGIVEAARERSADRIDWMDRAVFWSDSDDQTKAEAYRRRVAWHRGLLRHRALEAVALVERSASAHPLLRIGRGIAATHAALARVRTLGGSSSSRRHCPAFDVEPARRQLAWTLDALTRHHGGHPDRDALVARIRARIELARAAIAPPAGEPSTLAELVDLLASQLQRTQFVRHVQTLEAERPAAEAARRRAAQMDAQVGLIDRLNIFTDSAEERARDDARGEAAQRDQRIAHHRAEAHRLYKQAVSRHPPTQLADDGVDVDHRIGAIHAVSVRRTRTVGSGKHRRTETYYVCELRGRDEARASLSMWARDVMAHLGAFPCAGDLLDRWVAAELE